MPQPERNGPGRPMPVSCKETLAQREHEVARGRLNRQIAFDLGISEVTVKPHRSNAMHKMETASIGERIRVCEPLVSRKCVRPARVSSAWRFAMRTNTGLAHDPPVHFMRAVSDSR